MAWRVAVVGSNTGIVSLGANATINQTVLPPEAETPISKIEAPDRTVALPAFGPDLVGRDAEERVLGRAPIEVIHGLGGVGKSALAARYAERHIGQRNPVWWIDAASSDAVRAGLAEFAAVLQPGLTAVMDTDALADRATQWFAEHKGWLLLLDDVRARKDVAGLLSRVGAGRGHVLVTSRLDLDWRQLTRSIIRLRELTSGDAQILLTRRRPGERSDGAAELCSALGNLPLAVDLAAAFLQRTPLSPREYLAQLTKSSGAVFDPAAAVLQTTLDSISDPLAREILGIFAWYASQIPFGLIGDARAHRLPARDASAGRLLAAEAIAQLVAANLVTLGRDRTTVTVNPLLQSVLRRSGTDRERNLAVTCLSHAIPPSQEPETWPQWRWVLPHVTALADRIEPGHRTAELASMLNAAGLYRLARRGEAMELLRAAHDVYLRTRGRHDHDTLTVINNLALAHHAAGELTTAITLYEQVITTQSALDEITIASANNLACAHHELGRPAEAIRRLEPVSRRWITAHGQADHCSLILVANLARAYRSNGEPARATEVLHRLPAPDVWSPAAFDLLLEQAMAAQDGGDPGTAIALLEPALADALPRLGRDHHMILDAEHTIGMAYASADRWPEGVRALESALRGRTEVLGPAHRDTLDTRHMLGVAVANTGGTDRAIRILEGAASQCSATYGPADPDTMRVRADLDQLRRRSSPAT